MPTRIILYDALNSLSKGHLLRKFGDSGIGLYLEGVPHVAIVFEQMQDLGYLQEVHYRGHSEQGIQFFTITPAGRESLRRGRQWYFGLSPWLRLWGRLGLPLPR